MVHNGQTPRHHWTRLASALFATQLSPAPKIQRASPFPFTLSGVLPSAFPFFRSQAPPHLGRQIGMMQAQKVEALRPSSGEQLCLLALDGGGVRGLSSLVIIEELMRKIDAQNPPKPCDYFDMIGGTSTGGSVSSSQVVWSCCLLIV